MKLLLKDVRIINPDQGIDETTDLLIENGIISKIRDLNKEDFDTSEIFELDGKICVPGLFDMHVHLREPGREDTETVKTGSNAAAAGGFTGVACMPNTTPTIDSAEVVNSIKQKSKDHLVDVYPIGAVSKDRKGEFLAPIAELAEAGAIAFSDDGVAVKTASLLRNALEYLKMYDLPIIEHCEDESLAGGAMNEGSVSTALGLPSIPTIAEDLTVLRDISVAEYVDGKIHIAHISSKKSVELVRQAKAKGIRITAEVTPHHFCLTDEELVNYDTNYKMNPPLRTEEDVKAMIEGLKDGTIDCIASDHAPHSIEEKEAEFIYAPNGILGLETQLGLSISELVHKNHLTMDQLIEKLSINPRKILKIPVPQVKIGEIANLTIIDPEEIWTVDIKKFQSKSKNSPFDKRLLTGKSVAVINNKKLFRNGKFISLID
jgi:dihydroorotase